MAGVSLIVMEPGSEWPGQVGGSPDVVAVGDDGGLLHRTRHGIASLRRRGQHVRIAVLACNAAIDALHKAERVAVISELLVAVNEQRFGRVVLSASHRASLQLRHVLLSLADEMSPQLHATSAAVTVRFGESARAVVSSTTRGIARSR